MRIFSNPQNLFQIEFYYFKAVPRNIFVYQINQAVMSQKNNSWEQWRLQSSQYTLSKKNFYTYTESSISKDNFLFESSAFDHNAIQEEDNTNKQTKCKQRNKVNSKNYRERKKKLQEVNTRKLEQLELENRQLRAEKSCKWCNRPYQNYILPSNNKLATWENKQSTVATQFIERKLENRCKQQKNQPVREQMEFQDLQIVNAKDNKQKSIGKIWIAIAVLLLVLGFHMHGIQGGQLYWKGLDKVVLKKQQIQKWHNQFSKLNKQQSSNYSFQQQDSQEKDDYFTIKMLFQQKRYPQGIKSDKKQMIYEKQIQFQRQDKPIIPKIQFDDSPDQQQKAKTLSGLDSEQQFRIHKQFIYNFQAEIADIGRYL